jgi:hypothetical protein
LASESLAAQRKLGCYSVSQSRMADLIAAVFTGLSNPAMLQIPLGQNGERRNFGNSYRQQPSI